MNRNVKWLLPVIFLAACNNDNPTATKNAGAEHDASHSMSAAGNYSDSVNAGLIADDTLKGSPRRTAMNAINGNHVHIEYNSPGVRGRTIWGGLVGYDRVWVTGAHHATSIRFSKDVEVNGKKIAAGKYAIFTIPGREKWVAILNSRYDQHLADEYSEQEDIVRLEVTPIAADMVQRLTYTVNKLSDTTGELIMQWEKIRISIPFTAL